MDPFSLLTGAAIGGGAAVATHHFLTHRPSRERALADTLPWALLVDEGVILLKDATLLGGFIIRGHDLGSAPASALNQAANTVRELIGQLPSGWSLEINIHRTARRSYPCSAQSAFPSEVLAKVDMEREHHFTLPGSYYQTRHTLLFSFTPPRESVRKVEGVFVRGQTASENYAALIDGFQQAMEELQGFLSPSFEVRRMNDTDITTECHQCLSGDAEPVKPDGGYLNYALASGDLLPGFIPRYRNQHLYLVSITSFGPSVVVASGDFFNTLRDDVRWHMRYLPLSRSDAESRIRGIQKNWFSKRQGLRAFMPGGEKSEAVMEDPHAVAMQAETAEAQAEVAGGQARFGFLSNVVVVRDADLQRGKARATALVQRARETGFVAALESVNAPSAFLGSLPGFGSVNLRRLLVSSKVVSHLFPVTLPWSGDPHNPSQLFPKQTPPLIMVGGKGATPFQFHLHHGDVGHTLVIGATGAGKSVLVGTLMMSWLRYTESRVICFDLGRSHARLTEKAKGEHVNLGKATAPPIQPLRHLETETDRLWAESWVEGLCALAEVPITPEERIGIGHAIRQVAEESPEHRHLGPLHVNLPPRIAAVLAPYTVQGAFGWLFDGIQEEDREGARMRTIELSEVHGLGDTVTVPLLMILFRQIERALNGSPTLIVIEEAWAALMRPEFSTRMQQWLLTLRKQNAAVVIVAHNPLQIRQLPNASIITDSCPTRILLPNPEARIEEHAAVYRFLDLSNREIETIAGATQKRDYYYSSPRGSRLFDLCLGPKARDVLLPPKQEDEPSIGTIESILSESPSPITPTLSVP